LCPTNSVNISEEKRKESLTKKADEKDDDEYEYEGSDDTSREKAKPKKNEVNE
jgi:hypothetical protein